MRIVLHAGTHKTGTTSFQAALRRNARGLAAQGVRLMLTPPQANAANPALFDPGWLRARADAARQAGATRLVLSHEVISVLGPEELKRLIAALGPGELCYVVAFRHWVSFLPSRWRQNCRRRDAQGLPEFLDRLAAMPAGAHPFDFSRVIATARAAGIADIRVLSWEGARGNGGIVAPLWQACDLPERAAADRPGALVRTLLRGMRANRSDDAGREDVYRLFNHLRAVDAGMPENALFDVLCHAGPAPVFFDQADRVDLALRRDRGLARDIDAFLAAEQVTVRLDPAAFAPLAGRLEAAAAPFLVQGDTVFSEPRPRGEEVSAARGADLPASLRTRMRAALAQAEPRARARGALRARLLRLRDRITRA